MLPNKAWIWTFERQSSAPMSNVWQLRSEDGFITEQLRMQMSGDEGRFSHTADSISSELS